MGTALVVSPDVRSVWGKRTRGRSWRETLMARWLIRWFQTWLKWSWMPSICWLSRRRRRWIRQSIEIHCAQLTTGIQQTESWGNPCKLGFFYGQFRLQSLVCSILFIRVEPLQRCTSSHLQQWPRMYLELHSVSSSQRCGLVLWRNEVWASLNHLAGVFVEGVQHCGLIVQQASPSQLEKRFHLSQNVERQPEKKLNSFSNSRIKSARTCELYSYRSNGGTRFHEQNVDFVVGNL